MTRRIVWLVLLFVLPVARVAADDLPAAEQEAARSSADELLALIDAGDFQAAWRRSAPAAKERGDGAKFAGEMSRAQQALGKCTSRELGQHEFVTELPNLPAGKYVRFLFSSEFAAAGMVNESVALQQQPDGSWALLGYSVRPRR